MFSICGMHSDFLGLSISLILGFIGFPNIFTGPDKLLLFLEIHMNVSAPFKFLLIMIISY